MKDSAENKAGYLAVAFYLALTVSFGLSPCDTYASGFSEKEISMLPPYCKARLSESTADDSKWINMMGRGNFTGSNHYCYGLVRIQRCNKIFDKAKQASCLKRPIKEMTYTLEHTSNSFPYRPMVYFDRGAAYLRMNDTFNAEQDLLKAISLKPNYTRAYGKLFDIYFQRGELDRAREIIEKGLKQKPNSRSLKRRLKKLD